MAWDTAHLQLTPLGYEKRADFSALVEYLLCAGWCAQWGTAVNALDEAGNPHLFICQPVFQQVCAERPAVCLARRTRPVWSLRSRGGDGQSAGWQPCAGRTCQTAPCRRKKVGRRVAGCRVALTPVLSGPSLHTNQPRCQQPTSPGG